MHPHAVYLHVERSVLYLAVVACGIGLTKLPQLVVCDKNHCFCQWTPSSNLQGPYEGLPWYDNDIVIINATSKHTCVETRAVDRRPVQPRTLGISERYDLDLLSHRNIILTTCAFSNSLLTMTVTRRVPWRARVNDSVLVIQIRGTGTNMFNKMRFSQPGGESGRWTLARLLELS